MVDRTVDDARKQCAATCTRYDVQTLYVSVSSSPPSAPPKLAASGATFIRRCTKTRDALVDLAPLRTLGFSVACVQNFVLGFALYASLYLLPLFLGFVRFHSPCC